MSLKLDVCADADMNDAFAIISAAFGHDHPFIDALYPDHEQPFGRKRGGERLLAIKQSDPNTTFVKVVDRDTNRMIAVAKWNIYDGVVPEESVPDGHFWSSLEDKEYAQHLFHAFNVPRRKAIRESGGQLVCKSLETILIRVWRQWWL